MALMSPKVWGAMVIAFLLAMVGFQQVRVSNAKAATARAEAQFSDYRSKTEAQARQAEADNRQVEQSWQTYANQKGAQKDAEIKAQRDRADTLARELRHRESRPATVGGNVPARSGSCASSTGAGLYREDGEFLVGEAAAAAQIGKERDACYAVLSRLRASQGKATP